jgi:Winged helix-turn-helix domain (DUF2582)
MAKSKSTKPDKAKVSQSANTQAEHLEDGRGDEPQSVATRTPGVLSSTEIGHVAGDVWGLLVRDGAQTVSAIKKSISAPGDVVLAAIGWLAREGKLEFSLQGRSVRISLR